MLLFILIGGLCSNGQQIPAWKITDLNQHIDTTTSHILVINLWATFCGPCVKEIPHFIEFSNEHTGDKMELLLVSVDAKEVYPNRLQKFIKKHRFRSNFIWLDESDANFFIPSISSEWTGSIPATLFINKKTGKRLFVESELSKKELENLLVEIQSDGFRQVPVMP